MTDPEFLNWIANRFVHVIGESENVDFVQRLRNIAAKDTVLRGDALDAIDGCAAFHWGLLIGNPEHVQKASRECFREARQPFLVKGL